jgi:hypothetical protein
MASKLHSQSPNGSFHFTISQVAKMINVSPSTLRLWEQRGLARPHRTESGYRVYQLDDIERLKHRRAGRRRQAGGGEDHQLYLCAVAEAAPAAPAHAV